MITSLRIKNLAIIRDLEIDFREGFNILTGETGAGKSIIIDGIKLILGEKASSDLIRTGEKKATIEAIFSFPNLNFLKDSFPELAKEKEICIQREILASGKGKAYINGVLVPFFKLKKLGEKIVDIYGQSDHIFLLFPENHLDFLDYYGENLNTREEITNLAKELKSLYIKKKELEEKEREREQKLDFYYFQINEIERANLKENEEEELLKQRNRLRNAEKILSLAREALEISSERDNSLTSLLSHLKNNISRLSEYENEFKSYLEQLEESSIIINELTQSLINLIEKVQLDPAQLEIVEERLDLIDRLKRKYGNSIKEILDYLKKIKREVNTLKGLKENQEEVKNLIKEKFSDYYKKALFLSNKRKENAKRLEKEIEKEISLLGMEKARFKVNFKTEELKDFEINKIKEKGIDEVEFYISPNPGEDLRPLKKIASGGELSRIMLGLKSIGREKEFGKTLIFDEIDTGIGGKTAETIARKLKRLAKFHQVICITHLPQIASFATFHFKIEKEVKEGRTYANVKFLDFRERVEEIARLISGFRITPTSLRNAEEMLRQNLEE